MVVGVSPLFNDNTCFMHARELLAVQTFVSEATIETFDVSVLPWTTWLDVGRADIDSGKELSYAA